MRRSISSPAVCGPALICGGQAGQSVVEALVVLGALGSLVVAVGWLGRVQDIGLQLMHASRRVAFAHAHQGLEPPALPAHSYLAAPGHAWALRAATRSAPHLAPALLAGAQLSVVALAQEPSLQVGDPVPGSRAWRREMALGDAFVWRARAQAAVGDRLQTRGTLADFDRLALGLSREVAILRGTGAAASDAAVQDTLAESDQAWRLLASRAQREGRLVQARAQGVDAAWGRAQPNWDWLQPWAAEVPRDRLQVWGQP